MFNPETTALLRFTMQALRNGGRVLGTGPNPAYALKCRLARDKLIDDIRRINRTLRIAREAIT